MSIYQDLYRNPPKLAFKKDCKEVIFTTVSCMCDNVHHLHLKKNDKDEFHLSGQGNSISNWQMKGDNPKIDIEWFADDGEWDKVVSTINSGTSLIKSIRIR